MTNLVNADLGGKVVYLGNDVDKKVVRPGDKVRVVHYWKVTEPPGAEWRVFAHVNGGPGDWMNIDHSDMRAGHAPAKWRAGQIIRDEQAVTIGNDWKAPFAQITVGLYRRGGQAASDRMPVVSGPADAEARVLAARLSVVGKSAAPELSYAVRRAGEPIVIDGRADEAAWLRVPASPEFAATEGGEPVGQRTTARLLWDDAHLYVFIEAADRDVASSLLGRDDPLWKEDVVELFIDADGNRRGYVELQVNPHNAQFDAWFPRIRTGNAADTDIAWSADMKSAVRVRGTVDERGDEDAGWDVEIAIPLAAVRGKDEGMKVAIPPQLGDRWRLNVVRGDKPKSGQLRASSWSPITIRDFHALDRLLVVVFADENGQAPPIESALSAVTGVPTPTSATTP
jgi:hypothetical protein